ncbi:MAG TPA: xanthine dehydrogenase family protein molybdopterin-binding subunit [Myxococcota bacterium]|nr:xanthine dehydrogenase family protein molybdopterin-binding subunit [Myxococcota bacterium]HRY97321.1 xanthine dehydrogenase family protein molybdopterin-binding subunit [Myxococcota bacterium]HSA22453.1 xanthine dehydrogenase family protein molybdopterin-binding subunit [Myxococcota bacterium]
MNARWVGQDVPRVDGLEKVTGAARYTADVKLPRMLHAKVVRSPHPHARVRAVDLGKAARAPGVRAVASGQDFPFHVGIYLKDQTVFATDRVRFVGDAVAAVAAETPEAAEEAAALVEVEYEPLPALLDVRQGILPGAVLVHPQLGSYQKVPWITPEAGTNICNHLKVRKGDYEAALRGAAHVSENTFVVPQVQHVPMEVHVSAARVDLAGKLEVLTSAQSPFTVRHLLCACFNLSHGDVRVSVPQVGGGFGGKAGINLEPIATALALKIPGRWVRLLIDRAEEFYAAVVRQGLVATLVTGVDRQGKVVAQKMHYLWDCGAYGGYGVNVVRAAGYTCGGAYEFPNVCGDSIGVYTNRPVGSAYRGFGMQEIHWALEQQMDMVAHELGQDPVEFRLRNCLGPGKRTVTGQVLDEHAGRVDKCIHKVAEAFRRPLEEKPGLLRGRGLACAVKAPAMPNDAASSVLLKFCEDGVLEVLVSGIDYGQGLRTVAAQFAAEALGLPLHQIRVRNLPDTDLSPYDWQTVASRQTWATGNAVLKAAEKCKAQFFEMASQVLHAPVERLALEGGQVVDRGGQGSVPLTRMVMGYQFPDGHTIGGPVAAAAHHVPEGLLFLDPDTSQSAKPVAKWTFGAQGLEISVDPGTGQIQVDRVVACYDVGKVVNPGLIRGQTFGGVVQGLGTGLMEELKVDALTGRVRNASLVDYKIPTSEDLPGELEAHFVETPQADGPLGARGIGEHTMIPTPAALANALFDACGVRILDMPLTAEKVLRALQAKRAKE